jgi:hypothetical protein
MNLTTFFVVSGTEHGYHHAHTNTAALKVLRVQDRELQVVQMRQVGQVLRLYKPKLLLENLHQTRAFEPEGGANHRTVRHFYTRREPLTLRHECGQHKQPRHAQGTRHRWNPDPGTMPGLRGPTPRRRSCSGAFQITTARNEHERCHRKSNPLA